MAQGVSYRGAWQGQSQRGAWQNAVAGGTVNLTGTSAITSAVDAALLVIWALAGTSAITSAADAALTVGMPEALTGTAAITSAADGALSLGITEALTGTAGIVAAVDGGLIVTWALTGTAAITSAADGILTGHFHWSGMFYGYRGHAPPVGQKRRRWSFAGRLRILALRPWEAKILGPPPHDYKVYKGEATDDYAVDFQEVGITLGMARLIFCTIRDNPAKFIFTYDGVTAQPEREFGIGFARVEAIVGFKVKNATPGLTSWYQLFFQR